VLVDLAASDVQQDLKVESKKNAQQAKKSGKAKTVKSKKRRAVAQDLEEDEDEVEQEQEENTPPRRYKCLCDNIWCRD
jgi:hypothetical protein